MASKAAGLLAASGCFFSSSDGTTALLVLLAASGRLFGSSDRTTASKTAPTPGPPLAWLVVVLAGILLAAAAWESSRGSHLIGARDEGAGWRL
jgi:hypothetical protein